MYKNPHVLFRGTENYNIMLVKKLCRTNRTFWRSGPLGDVVQAGWCFMEVWFQPGLIFEAGGEKICSVRTALCSAVLPDLACGLKFYSTKQISFLYRLQYLTEADHPLLHPGLSVNRSVIKYNLRNKFKI